MKNLKNSTKQYSLVYSLSGKRKMILKTIFMNFDLDGLKDHLEYWKYAALVNEIDMYESGKERKLLLQFCTDLEKVFEVFYLLSKQKEKQLKLIPSGYRKTWKKHNKYTALTKDEKSDPQVVLKSFTERYTRKYALAEVVDMLEALITLRKGVRSYRHSAVSFFLCVNALIDLIYS